MQQPDVPDSLSIPQEKQTQIRKCFKNDVISVTDFLSGCTTPFSEAQKLRLVIEDADG